MSNNDGGPAFPREEYQDCSRIGQQGMSLRDYFAAAALQGMMSNPRLEDDFSNDRTALAEIAYEQADAMLAERDKP